MDKVLYRPLIRFVVRSDERLNPEYGRSTIGAERPILILRYYIHAEFILVTWWDFNFLTILRHPGERAVRPREVASPRAPLAESIIGARCFAWVSKGCCVGRAWRHREAARGRAELGTFPPF